SVICKACSRGHISASHTQGITNRAHRASGLLFSLSCIKYHASWSALVVLGARRVLLDHVNEQMVDHHTYGSSAACGSRVEATIVVRGDYAVSVCYLHER